MNIIGNHWKYWILLKILNIIENIENTEILKQILKIQYLNKYKVNPILEQILKMQCFNKYYKCNTKTNVTNAILKQILPFKQVEQIPDRPRNSPEVLRPEGTPSVLSFDLNYSRL